MLTIENVHKAFVSKRGSAVAVLRELDLVVEAGQALALVGPSGCGKSTLLRIIAGLDGEYDGAVRVNGARVAGPGAERGLEFQEHRLLPWLTLAENVAFGIEDWALAERDRRVRELITLVGLSGFEGAYPQQLAAELMGASKGLGYLLVDGQTTGRPELVIAAIVSFAVLGKASDRGLEYLGARLQPWRPA
jgi:sulfonate transport system ATP-binding protein